MNTTTPRTGCSWKANWNETAEHYINWWNQKGYVIGSFCSPLRSEYPIEDVPAPTTPSSIEEACTDPVYVAARIHHELAQGSYPADCVPMSWSTLGPGSLALWLGSRPEFTRNTVWYHPCASSVEELPPLKFDAENRWWKLALEHLHQVQVRAQGRYLNGCPDLIEGLDILASLIGAENMFADMKEMPELIHMRLHEINQVWIKSYDEIYNLIKDEEGAATFWAFSLWGPGRTAKIQCDVSAMLSPAMFKEFAVPYLREQCRYLDYSMFHLDGTQCIPHLDHLLSIGELDAIEWTPQTCAGKPGGGAEAWHDMYRRIKNAGKSVQVVNISPAEIIPLFDSVGPDGMFILTQFKSKEEAETLTAELEKHFPNKTAVQNFSPFTV